MTRPCAWRPYPGSGAYGDWTCDRPKWHLGRHRFINYTIPRFPRVWHLRSLRRAWRADRRIRAMTGKSGAGFGYRRMLWPARYDPVRSLTAEEAARRA